MYQINLLIRSPSFQGPHTGDSGLGVQKLEQLFWDDAMADLSSLLWQWGNGGQTLGRGVQGVGGLDQPMDVKGNDSFSCDRSAARTASVKVVTLF